MSFARCRGCGCRLAADRRDVLCSPCARRGILREVRGLAAPSVPLAVLRRAMRGGVREVARVAGVDRHGAAELIVQFGLLPPRCRMPPPVLRALVERPSETNTALAARFGVSRWAIAGWRKILEPPPPSTRPAPQGVAHGVPYTATRLNMATGKGARGAEDHPPTTVVEIAALGPLEVRVDGRAVRLPARSRAVLGALALAHPTVLEADTLAEIASPGRTGAQARRALHTTVWRIRQVLPPGVLARAGPGYRLDLRGESSLDVVRFQALTREAEQRLAADDAAAACDLARRALECWRGAPLADTPLSDTTLPAELDQRRRALRELWADETETLGRALLHLGNAEEAAGALVELTREHPLRERAWSALIEAQAQLRQWQDVASSCEAARAALDEVGLQPGPELAAALAAAAERGEPTPQAPRPPDRAPSTPPAAEPPSWLRMAAERGPFIGRETEFAVALRAVEAATEAGTPAGLVLLRGEAGVGKTRLAAEIARLLAGRGVAVWAGRTDPFGTVPYAALTEALRTPFTVVLEQLTGEASARLADGPLARLLFGRPEEATAATEVTAQQAALLRDLTDLARHATRDRGLLLLIEDAHWASRSTLLLLQRALRALATQPVCLLITWRDSLQVSAPTAESLRQLAAAPGTTALHLGGLSAVDIATHPDLPADGDHLRAAEHYRRLSGGNPLLLSELLLRDDERHPPIGLAAAIDTRIAELGPEVQDVLAVGAALGAEFDVPSLREVAATLPAPREPTAINAAVDRAIRAGIVDLLPDGTRLAFHHELLRTGLLDDLGAASRAALHLAVADVLTTRPGADRPPLAYQVATQLWQARLIADHDRVTAAAEQASRLAAADLDFASAATWHERAAISAAEVTVQVAHHLAAAEAWRGAGAPAEARRTLAEAAGIAERGGSRRGAVEVAIAMGELDVVLDRRISDVTAGQLARVRDSPPTAADGEDDDRLLLIEAIEQAGGGSLADRLLGAGRRALRPDTLLAALWWSPPSDRARFAAEIARQADSSGVQRTAVLAALAGWVVGIETGAVSVDDPEHRAQLDRAVAGAADAPDAAHLRWMRDAWDGARHLVAGRLDAAQAAIVRASEALGAPGMPEAAASQVQAVRRGQEAMLRLVRRYRSGVSDIFLHVDRHWNIEPSIWDLGTALALANAGRRDEAHALATPSLETTLHPATVTPSPLGTLAMLTMVAERLGDAAIGERLLPALGDHHGEVAILRHNQILGPVDHYYGVAASLTERWSEAIEHLDAARALAARAGHDAILLRTRTAAIRARIVRRGPGDRAAVQALAAEQRTALSRLGIPAWELDHLDL